MKFAITNGIILLLIHLSACSDDSLISTEDSNEAETFFCHLLSEDARNECLRTEQIRRQRMQKDVMIKADINIQISLDSDSLQVSRKKPKDEICTLCKNSIRTYEKMINRTMNATEIQKTLIQACSIYNCELQHYCILFLEGKGLKVIKDILHKREPTRICKTIHLCRRERRIDSPFEFLDMFVSLSKRRRPNLCQKCLKAVNYSEEYINTTNTPEQVQQYIFNVCDIFKSQYQNVCRTYFSTTGFEIIKSALTKEDPKIICQKLNFCPNKTDKGQPNIISSISVKHPHKKSDEVCSLCKHWVGVYEKVVNRSMNATDIQIPLVKACSIYNCNLQHYCILFFQGTGFEVINDILQQHNPQKICQKMKVCQKRRFNIPHQILIDFLIPVTKRRPKDLCKSCKSAVEYSEEYINTTNTPEEVLQMILNVCEIFQAEYKESCKQYASTTGLEIIQKALNKEDTKTICQSLKLCPSEIIHNRDAVDCVNNHICKKITATVNEKALQTKSKRDIKNEITKVCDGINFLQPKCLQFIRQKIDGCKLCTEVVFLVDRLAIPKKNKESLNHSLDKACYYIPLSIAKECQAFVKTYRAKIVKLFLDKVNWEAICSWLRMCPSLYKESNINEEISSFLPKVNYGFYPGVV